MVRQAEPGHEKRQLSRIPCKLPLSNTTKSAPLGEISDISLDGLFVRTPAPLSVGAILPIAFTPKKDQPEIRAQAEVVRITHDGMGLRFLNMSGQASRRLRRLATELTDVEGHKHMATRLMDTAGRATTPITDAPRIAALLQQSIASKTPFTLIPADRTAREQHHLTQALASELVFCGNAATQLRAGDTIFAMCTMDFVSYSFPCQVQTANGDSVHAEVPTSLFYSERRSSRRDVATQEVYIRIPLPWKDNAQVSWQVFDTSPQGLSFRVAASEAHFLPGTPLLNAVLSTGDETVPLVNACVKHLTLMRPDDGEAWLKVGVEFGVKRESGTVSQHTFEGQTVATTPLQRILAFGRNISTSTAYMYHRKFRSGRAVSVPPFRVVRFKNQANKQIVGLLNTSFVDGAKVRAPLVIVIPGFGGRKETFSTLAMTIVDNFRRQNRDIAVLRIDGTNNLGESEKDPGCEGDGKHTLKYTMSGGIADVEGALEWARSNKYVDPTDILFVSASFGTVPVRRVLTTPAANAVSRWFVLMGASDAQSIMLHGAGNLDIYGNYLRGIEMGVIQLVGCLADADYFCRDMQKYQVATLEDARTDMAKIKADITWVLGTEDALADPRRVHDIMSVAAPGKREIIEVNAGHLPRTGDEALAQFALITQKMWKHLFGRDIQAQVPNRGWLAVIAKTEWDRTYKSSAVNSSDYWRTYLLGTDGLGFDILNMSPKYRGLVDTQVRLAQASDKHVLDVGAGTGNVTEALAKSGVASVTACDLVAEALERLKNKVQPVMDIDTTACNIDGTATTLMRRWVAGDLHSPMQLAGRLPGLSASAMQPVIERYSDALHAYMRGFSGNKSLIAQEAKLNAQQMAFVEDIHTLSRAVRHEDDLRGIRLQAIAADAFKSAGGLPFEASRFDAIVCSLVLSYLNFPDDTLFEMHRVLKPGGRLVISSMKHDADTSKIYFEVLQWLHTAPEAELPEGKDRQALIEVARNFSNSAAELLRIEEEGSFRFYSGDELVEKVCRAGFHQPTVTESFGEPGQAVVVTCDKL